MSKYLESCNNECKIVMLLLVAVLAYLLYQCYNKPSACVKEEFTGELVLMMDNLVKNNKIISEKDMEMIIVQVKNRMENLVRSMESQVTDHTRLLNELLSGLIKVIQHYFRNLPNPQLTHNSINKLIEIADLPYTAKNVNILLEERWLLRNIINALKTTKSNASTQFRPYVEQAPQQITYVEQAPQPITYTLNDESKPQHDVIFLHRGRVSDATNVLTDVIAAETEINIAQADIQAAKDQAIKALAAEQEKLNREAAARKTKEAETAVAEAARKTKEAAEAAARNTKAAAEAAAQKAKDAAKKAGKVVTKLFR